MMAPPGIRWEVNGPMTGRMDRRLFLTLSRRDMAERALPLGYRGGWVARMTARFKSDNSATDLSSYTGIRFWVRGDGSFRVRTVQPTITDWDDYGTSLLQATPDWKPVVVLFGELRQEGWGITKDFTPQALTGFAIENFPAPAYPPRPASGLYEGMITALAPYPLRGAIWYQGESNALEAYQYRKLLPALIQSWRASWNEGHFPF